MPAAAVSARPRRLQTHGRTPRELGFSFPAEWRPHAGTWISWPRPEGISFPDRYHESIRDVVGVIRTITAFERVHLNVPNGNYRRLVREMLREGGVRLSRVTLHEIPTNECWTRDHGPAFVTRTHRGHAEAAIVDWGHNAWGGKYPPWDADDAVPTRVGDALGLPVFHPGIVMEGGAIDVNGAGTLMTTTSCLLHRNRNPHLSKDEIEQYLRDYYGQQHILWLGDGIEGDDTDGHIDDLARFIDARTIVIGLEDDPADRNTRILRSARRALDRARDQDGNPFTIVEVPMPRRVEHAGQRLPATYMNFYFVNGAVLVPTFGQPSRDRAALAVLQRCMPARKVVGVDCRALIWGLGAIHCLTQQQPRV